MLEKLLFTKLIQKVQIFYFSHKINYRTIKSLVALTLNYTYCIVQYITHVIL